MWTRTSPEQTERFLDQQAKNQARQKRRQRLYNRKYRKSCLFVSAWAIRITFVTLYIAVFFLHDRHGSYTKEVVLDKEIEEYKPFSSSKPPRRGVNVHIQTDHESYTANIIQMKFADFIKGDTLLIERNVFDKPIYFRKAGWGAAYPFNASFRYYYMVLFVTLISFAFNDGLDRFTNKLLKIIMALDLFAIACYFLM